MRNIDGSSFKHLHHVGVEIHRCAVDSVAIDAKENIYGSEGYPLITIDEGMIGGQTFHKCSRFGDNVGVVACLGAKKRRLKRSRIAEAGRTAIALNQ